jgi:hypothetical protein
VTDSGVFWHVALYIFDGGVWCRQGGDAFRFVARFSHAPGYPMCGPSDLERTFVFAFFLATDEVFVFEPPVRNSGIVGGKFFERARVTKPGGTEAFSAQDFYVGALVPLASRYFFCRRAAW